MLAAVLRDRLLAVGTSSGRIALLDIVSGQQLRVVSAHDRGVTALAAGEVGG